MKTKLAVTAVMLSMLLAILDGTIVGTALPRIVGQLGGAGHYTWVVTAYLLTSTVTVPMYGRLSDSLGRKPLLLAGIAVFLAGSVLSGLAGSMSALIAARALQGLGAGALMPLGIALAGDLFPAGQGAKVNGAVGAVLGIGYLTGPAVGGLLTDHAGWRWVFYVNVPLGLAAMAILVVALPHEVVARRRVRLDWTGIAVFGAAIALVLVGLTEKGLPGADGRPHAWTDTPVLGPLAAGIALLGAFAAVEARATHPIMPLGLFRNRGYAIACLAAFFAAFAMYAGIVFLPRYFQQVRGDTATAAGLRVYPVFAGVIIGSYGTGMLIARTGRYRRWLLLAMLPLAAGALLFAGLGAGTPTPLLAVWMLLLGLGIGPTLSGLTIAIQLAVDPAHRGMATGAVTFFRQIGGSVALALGGSLASQRLLADLPHRLAGKGVPPDAARAAAHQLTAGTGTAGRHLPPVVADAAHQSLAHSLGVAVSWLGVCGAVIAVAALALLPERPLTGPPAQPATSTVPATVSS
jgi:EmrB/QacA subfamily drug resistance transporter